MIRPLTSADKTKFLRAFVFLLSLIFSSTQTTAYSQTPKAASTLHQQLSDSNSISRTDVTNLLLPTLKPYSQIKELSYSDIERLYRRSLERFSGLYPNSAFDIKIRPFLESFSGRKKIVVPELLKIPFMPLTPLGFAEKDLKIETLKTSFKGKTINGLRVSAQLTEEYKSLPPPDQLLLSYIPDVNARILGFTNAQLILPLSRNIEPAAFFQYNGLRKWSEHQRYSKIDQVSKPIVLTNFAHQNGSLYAVSVHPDFALKCRNINTEDVLMTFFLWKGKPTSTVPDFIFQFLLQPR